MSDLIFHAGAECYELYGTLSKRTSLEEDVAETFTRSSVAKYVDRAGLVLLADANVLRTEWTGSDFSTPNLLLEGARTNGWTRSEELDDAVWTKQRSSISAGAVVAPDATASGDKIVEDSSDDSHIVSRTIAGTTNDTDQALSLYARKGERTWIKVALVLKDGTSPSAFFDLANGVVGTTSAGVTARIEAVGNTWFRCSIVTDVLSGGTTPAGQVFLADADNSASYQGDGASGLFVWGMQFEIDASFPSSYIQTVGSTVTRNAETCSFPFDAPPQEMTGYARFIESGTSQVANGAVLHIGAAGATNPRFRIVQDGGAGAQEYQVVHITASGTVVSKPAVVPSFADLVELRPVLNADGSVQMGISTNSGSETLGSASSALALGSAWGGQTVYPNSTGSTNPGFAAFQSIKIARGTKTMAEMRSLGV